MKYGHRLWAFSEVFGTLEVAQRSGRSGAGAASQRGNGAAASRPPDSADAMPGGTGAVTGEDSGRESSAGYETSVSSGGGSASQRSPSPAPMGELDLAEAPQTRELLAGPRAPVSPLLDLRTVLSERYRSLYAMYKLGKSAVGCIRAALGAKSFKTRPRSTNAPSYAAVRSRHLQSLARALQVNRVPPVLERVFDAVWVFIDSILGEIAALVELFRERTADLDDRLQRLRRQRASGSVRSAFELGAEAEQVLVCLQIAQVAIGKILKKFLKALSRLQANEEEEKAFSASLGFCGTDALNGSGVSESEHSSTTTAPATSSGACTSGEDATRTTSGCRNTESAPPNSQIFAHIQQSVHLAMRASLVTAGILDAAEDMSLPELVKRLQRYLVQQPFVCDQRRLGFLTDLRHRKDCAVVALYRASKRSSGRTASGPGVCPVQQQQVSGGVAGGAEGSPADRHEGALGAISLLRQVLDGDAAAPKSRRGAVSDPGAVHPSARVRPFVEECRAMARQLESELVGIEATKDPSSPYEVAARFYLANTMSNEPATTTEAVFRAARSVSLYFVCPICLDMLFETTELACHHRFCTLCVAEARFSAEARGARFRCPLCQADVTRRRCCEAEAVDAPLRSGASSVPAKLGSGTATDSLSETTALPVPSERRASSVDDLLRAAFHEQWRLRERQTRSMRALLEQRRRFRERVEQLDAGKARARGSEPRDRSAAPFCGCFGGRARSSLQPMALHPMPVAPEMDNELDTVSGTKPSVTEASREAARADVLANPERPQSGCRIM
jgi:hypothetical protein